MDCNVTCGGWAAAATVKVSYMEEMIRHKILTGLADINILQDVLAADLKETVVFVEGKEIGKNGQQSLASTARVNKISTTSGPVTTTPGRCKCKNCGRPWVQSRGGYKEVISSWRARASPSLPA